VRERWRFRSIASRVGLDDSRLGQRRAVGRQTYCVKAGLKTLSASAATTTASSSAAATSTAGRSSHRSGAGILHCGCCRAAAKAPTAATSGRSADSETMHSRYS